MGRPQTCRMPGRGEGFTLHMYSSCRVMWASLFSSIFGPISTISYNDGSFESKQPEAVSKNRIIFLHWFDNLNSLITSWCWEYQHPHLRLWCSPPTPSCGQKTMLRTLYLLFCCRQQQQYLEALRSETGLRVFGPKNPCWWFLESALKNGGVLG